MEVREIVEANVEAEVKVEVGVKAGVEVGGGVPGGVEKDEFGGWLRMHGSLAEDL